MALRPRGRARCRDRTMCPRGKNAAHVRSRRVPARERAAFEVVEPELALEIFVPAFGAPSFLENANDLLFGHAPRQGRERELGRPRFARGPLDDEPGGVVVGGHGAVVMRDLHAT